MNHSEITRSVENIKSIINAQRGHQFTYEIWYKNPMISDSLLSGGTGSSNVEKDQIFDKFSQDLENVLNSDAVQVQVIVKRKGKVIADPVINIRPEYAGTRFVVSQQQPQQGGAMPQMQVDATSKLGKSELNVNGVLALLGFDGLNGADDSITGGMVNLLAVRDQFQDTKRRLSDLQNELDKVKEEKTRLECEKQDLQQQLDKANKENEEQKTALNGFDDEKQDLIEQLQEAQAEKEKAKGIGGLLGAAALAIIKSKGSAISAKVPLLAGVVDVLNGADEGDAQPKEVAPQQDEPRANEYTQLLAYLRGLGDEDFAQVWQVIIACAKDKTNIATMLDSLTGGEINNVN